VTAFPWAPTEVLCWRLDARQYQTTWDSGRGAELAGGRWNPKGFAAVYAAVDPSTAVLEVAVHKGFDVLDRVPHVVSCAEIFDPSLIHVVDVADLPNKNWLRPGTPGRAQQQFGVELLKTHPFVAIPSAVLPLSWNLIFNPDVAAGAYRLDRQIDFALDTRLNPPAP
jgi:RES domain-containing protein